MSATVQRTSADMGRMSGEHLDQFRTFVEARRWKGSTSAAQQRWPHEYTIRSWAPEAEDEFVTAVRIIRCYGHTEKFFRHIRIYLEFDGIKYWTMGGSLDETVVINRAEPDSLFGKQDAPPSPSFPLSVYDWLATEYDQRYSSIDCQVENEVIADKIRELQPHSILDIGCGTGLAIEMMPELRPGMYLGIEPARGMFNEFLRKHPAYPIVGEPLSRIGMQYDLALALFGVASYLEPADIDRLPGIASRWLLMFYRPGYQPDYSSPSDRWNSWRDESYGTAMDLPNASVDPFGNFLIVVGQT